MLRPFLSRVLLSVSVLAACAFSAFASEVSWLDGEWTPDVEALVNETFPKATEEYKAEVTAKVRERMSGIAIDTEARVMISKKADGDVRITITGFQLLSEGGMKMATRDERTGATGNLIWKHLSDDKIEMHKPDGSRVVFLRKK